MLEEQAVAAAAAALATTFLRNKKKQNRVKASGMELNEVQLGGLCLSPVNGNCLALLPKESSENQTASAASPVQKVIVGDNTGRVLCFAAKNPNVEVVSFVGFHPSLILPLQIIWKVELNAPITCICMGGANNVRDKIFVASGSSVAGINRKVIKSNQTSFYIMIY
jgi:hypothetical protein